MEVWTGFHTPCIYAGILTDWWKASTAALINIGPCHHRTQICLGGFSWLIHTVWRGWGLGLVQLHLPFCPQALSGVSFLLFLSPHALLSLSWKAVPCSIHFFQSHFLHAPDLVTIPCCGLLENCSIWHGCVFFHLFNYLFFSLPSNCMGPEGRIQVGLSLNLLS